MSEVGQLERATQDRVVELFEKRLGYRNLGNWESRDSNSNIELTLLESNLEQRGYSAALIGKAVADLKKAAAVGSARGLYEANRDVYEQLRYGIKEKEEAGQQKDTVWLIDWENPDANEFAVAEEVTVLGQNTKRPDIVLYVNGIALVTLELKRSKVAVSEGIRQSIGNQSKEYIRPFFSTVQLLLAGNDVEGLHYGVIDTPEKYWLKWKLPKSVPDSLREELDEDAQGLEDTLDCSLAQVCSKRRLLELIHDFIVFDEGVKKAPRPNQYVGVKSAQLRIAQREGGIIWHTQGSGKSLTMVWLAKWLRENQPDARVLLITDRTELDEQIKGVFAGVSEEICRTKSGSDLLAKLNDTEPWLICSLIHKFRGSAKSTEDGTASFIEELLSGVRDDFEPKGNLFVFVDEAHRTQTGTMNKAMKRLLPNAMFIGFTGTPLLKADKATSIETFGTFIHTYKFDEAVADEVVLDLRYEARGIDQRMSSKAAVDKWFDAKTKGMSDVAKAKLKKRWGSMQALYSSASRAQQIVNDILLDMETKPRLIDGRGNAMLVCDSIYQACKSYELFCQAGFKGKCAIVTSYKPEAGGVSKEDSGEGETEKLHQYAVYRQMLADHFDEPADKVVNKVELFEEQVKERFVKDPGQMRLLIVVDKLLTGFDAPAATYLYIDKKMQNHGLFQAICRVNRLDGDDKDYGYIVDYRDLFKSLQGAVEDYTGEALDGYEPEDVEGLLSDRLQRGKEDLDEALDKVHALCEPVAPPKGTTQYQHYFCAGPDGDAEELKANEPKRLELYKSVAALIRAYSNLANEMEEAGYTPEQVASIKADVEHYANVRDEVKLGAGEELDLKQYEAGMRWLLDTYIQADPSEPLVDFGDRGLIDLIVDLGDKAIDRLPKGIRNDPTAVAETIVNNVRKLTIDKNPTNPKYYGKMSELLDALIEEHRRNESDYAAYLEKLLSLAKQVAAGEMGDAKYPEWADNGAKRSLVDFGLPGGEEVAQQIDRVIRETKRADWVDNPMKEKRVRNALSDVLSDDYDRIDELMELVKARDEYR